MNAERTKRMGFGLVAALLLMTTGCLFGNQPVRWTQSGTLDYSAGAKVSVEAQASVDPGELEYMRHDISARVRQVLTGREVSPDAYMVKVVITRYDEGDKFARYMLIGLGQMYLFGTVEVTQGHPPVVVRSGDFRKQYRVGGLFGGMAGPRDITSKLGKAIAEGLMEGPSGRP